MPKKFITPPALPETTQSRGLVIPASKEWLAVFSAALLETIYSYNYEQTNPTDLTPEDVASAAFAIYEAWLTSTCGGGSGEPCPDIELPNGQKVWRQNPVNRRYEVFNEELGDWEFPDGVVVASLPLPEPREELTDEEKLCNASANAVWVLYQVWLEMLNQWNNNVEPALAQAAFATEVAGAVGGAFYPPIAAVTELIGIGFSFFFEIFGLITLNTWDGDLLQHFTCAFREHATLEDDDTVTFNQNAIILKLNLLSFQNPQWMLATVQLHYILAMLGQEGLNVAGGTTALTDADCTCGVWGREWEFADMLEGLEWNLAFGQITTEFAIEPLGVWPGRFAATKATIQVEPETTFMQIGIRTFVPMGQYHQTFLSVNANPATPWLHSGNPDDVDYASHWAFEAPPYHTDTYSLWTIDKGNLSGPLTFTAVLRHQGVGTLRGIRIWGTGPCPFQTGTIL